MQSLQERIVTAKMRKKTLLHQKKILPETERFRDSGSFFPMRLGVEGMPGLWECIGVDSVAGLSYLAIFPVPEDEDMI